MWNYYYLSGEYSKLSTARVSGKFMSAKGCMYKNSIHTFLRSFQQACQWENRANFLFWRINVNNLTIPSLYRVGSSQHFNIFHFLYVFFSIQFRTLINCKQIYIHHVNTVVHKCILHLLFNFYIQRRVQCVYHTNYTRREVHNTSRSFDHIRIYRLHYRRSIFRLHIIKVTRAVVLAVSKWDYKLKYYIYIFTKFQCEACHREPVRTSFKEKQNAEYTAHGVICFALRQVPHQIWNTTDPLVWFTLFFSHRNPKIYFPKIWILEL